MAAGAGTTPLYDPVGAVVASTARLSPRLDSLEGKVLAMLDNTKPNFSLLLANMETLLLKKYPTVRFVVRRKGSAAAGAGDPLIAELAESCDALITGSGD
ncbi:MAG: hypothetical protein ABIH46_09325 [Chloroflexota bacterium]